MNVSLTPRLEEVVRKKVDSGLYRSASEVVREALRQMDERDTLAQLRAAIAIGEKDISRGDVTSWTATSLRDLIHESEEEDRLDSPISADVQP